MGDLYLNLRSIYMLIPDIERPLKPFSYLTDMKIRSILLSALFTCCAFLIVTYTACTKDSCKDVLCQNNGICVDGNCKCPSGYGGTNCETVTDPCVKIQCKNEGVCENGACKCPAGFEGELCEQLSITKYFGVWQGKDSCSGGSYAVDSLVISSSPASNKSARIHNPAGLGQGYTVTGELTGANVITIPSQSVATGITFKGSITFSTPNNMVFTYAVSGFSQDSCSGTYNR